jgi:hypothetical protein
VDDKIMTILNYLCAYSKEKVRSKENEPQSPQRAQSFDAFLCVLCDLCGCALKIRFSK